MVVVAAVGEPPSTLTIAYVFDRGASLRSFALPSNGKAWTDIENSKVNSGVSSMTGRVVMVVKLM